MVGEEDVHAGFAGRRAVASAVRKHVSYGAAEIRRVRCS
jgi:hypothetical protein